MVRYALVKTVNEETRYLLQDKFYGDTSNELDIEKAILIECKEVATMIAKGTEYNVCSVEVSIVLKERNITK